MKRNLENVVPNAVIVLRIMLTCPVSLASGERSFSELNSLTIISIEHELAKLIDYEDIIEEFASLKARKKTVS